MENKKRVTKLVKVFTDKAYEQPTFLITYQTYQNEANENKSEIIREKVHVINMNSRHRYYGKTPIVFIRREHERDVEVLNLAKTIKTALENDLDVKHERDIMNTVKRVLKSNMRESTIKKSVFYDVYGEIMFKRPHIDFVTLTNNMLKNVEVK